MGSVCSSDTKILVHGRFDMPGVPAQIAKGAFCDIQAAPSFIPLFLSIETVRGQPSEVGFCWLEKRRIGQQGEVVLRKTITKRSDHPLFTQSAHNELVRSSSCTIPDFISTYTLTIHPTSKSKSTAAVDNDDDHRNDDTDGCTIHWTDAIMSRGLLGRFLSALCLPCLKRLWIAQTQEEWQYYYEEALRRTRQSPPQEDVRG